MPPPVPKLFHAIVGLGLANAACGGDVDTAALDASPRATPRDASTEAHVDASTEAHVEASTEVDATSVVVPDATEIHPPPPIVDADALRDAAEDVGHDAFIQIPVK